MATRKKQFLKLTLECGHEEIIPTEHFILRKVTAEKMVDEAKKNGVTCITCLKKTFPIAWSIYSAK